MKSQIFVAIVVAIVASVLVTGLASSINAQSNMTGGNRLVETRVCRLLEPQVTVEATTVMEMMETVMTTVMEKTAVTEKTSRTS